MAHQGRYRRVVIDEQAAIGVDDLMWLCGCGNVIDGGCHCTRCGAEPPWGCPCGFCQDGADQQEEEDFDVIIDDMEVSDEDFEQAL